ncbi:MAG: thioredoxin family protein [Chitinophagaceae bacterium]|nr:thioredoxin family protein [Chitinophagaceae bacterium]
MPKSAVIRLLFLFLLLTAFSFSISAQYANPNVEWSFDTKKIKSDEFDLLIKAKIGAGYHLYSQFIGEGGPIPSSFTFENSKDYKRIGIVKEVGNRKEAIEPLFDDMKLIWYEEYVTFSQRVKINASDVFVNGMVSFMTCNDRSCDPPSDQKFEFKLTGTPAIDTVGAAMKQIDDRASVGTISKDSIPDTTSVGAISSVGVIDSTMATAQVNTEADEDDVRRMSYWQTFLAGFGYGLIALLMPCVWPVIPLTISFFLKQNKSKQQGRFNAFLYGFFIIVIFVLLGILVSLFTNEQKLNELSTGWFFNLLFFVLFFLFGLSFLGVFEIRVPSSWINKSESLSDRGGLIGIFFMAFSLVLVSFSCTLPFVANLISIVSRDGEFVKPLIGFSAFGLALGLPFGLFAWFPSGLKKLPKSGGWMNTIKVSFGFIELALSFIYLSKVDMAYHWNFLSRDIFLSIWIIIFLVLGLYLLGKIRLALDGDSSHISVPRLLFALVSLAFAIYMVPGLWGAPLKPLSGFLPVYSEFTLEANVHNQPYQENSSELPVAKKYGSLFESPLGLDLYFEYDEALAKAKELKKPLFVDFTGWGCVNCRKMEKSVWPDPEVLKRLRNEYVMVSLYVDDKFELPKDQQYFSKALDKQIITLGDRNFDIQYSNYGIGAQPYYVLLDNEGKLLTPPRAYTADISTYVRFLDEGISKFKARNMLLSSK